MFFATHFLLMWIATIIGLDGTVGTVLLNVIKIILYICTAIMAVLVGIWFIMKGKPYRDKVVGPKRGRKGGQLRNQVSAPPSKIIYKSPIK